MLLERADPQAASSFRDGARAFTAEINSTGIDYESTLSTCPRHTIVTPDAAFLNVAGDYGLSDDVVGTDRIPIRPRWPPWRAASPRKV